MAPPREDETRELIEQLGMKRNRRRWARILLMALGAAVVLAAVIAGAVFATAGPSDDASGATSSLVAGVSTTGPTATTATSINEPVTTTERVTTTEPPAAASGAGAAPQPATSAPATTSATDRPATRVVVIDPGHQAHADPALEPLGPGSSQKKAKVSSGTSSPSTGTPESELTLAVGLKLRDALEARGIKVVMTRTTQDVNISNVQRAKVANAADADLTIRLHANGSTDHSVHGLFTLYPVSIKGWTDDIAAASKEAATIVPHHAIAATGAQDRGLQPRSDLTGFNWSNVPVVLVEMGFMSNTAEEKKLESEAYQDRMAQGLVKGIVEFLETM
jgi:N-acetylmuramoyl-L-alanine amidase